MTNEERAKQVLENIDNYVKECKKGRISAADVAAHFRILSHFGGEVDMTDPANVNTRDEVLDSIRDLDLDNLH